MRAQRTPATLTPQQVAAELQLHVNTVYQRLQDGTIPARKVGGSWRIPARALAAWLEGA